MPTPSGRTMRWAVALGCGALACASNRPGAVTAAPAAPPERAAAQPAASAEAPASHPDDPPNARREAFRGCSIAVPGDSTREDVDMGLRVVLPTDDGGTVALGVVTRVWTAGDSRDWASFERGLRNAIATQHGEMVFFSSPVAEGGAVDAAWRQHLRIDRRERGRVLVQGGRFAVLSCSALVAEYGDRQGACDAMMESLSLGRPDARAPSLASPAMRWIGERGIFAQAPEGWLPQRLSRALVSLVERYSDAAGLVELNGGDLEVPPAQMLATLRQNMERAGARFASWVVQQSPHGTKVDYVADATTRVDRFIRQRVLVRGWRMCVATCAGPEDFVVAHDSFCGHWLPTLRVAR